MRRIILAVLLTALVLNPVALAGIGSKAATYQGGTTRERDFAGAKDAVEGILNTGDEKVLKFEYTLNKQSRVCGIPYAQIIDIEYGQKAGRRVGAAVATPKGQFRPAGFPAGHRMETSIEVW